MQCVTYILCSVCVCVFALCIWWSLKMVYDVWKARRHNTETYWLPFILDSLVFFLSRDETHFIPEAVLTYLLKLSLIFSQHRFDLDCRCRGGTERRRERGRVVDVDFLWVWVLKHYLLFRGCCCSEAAGWRALLALPNRNREHDALIKNPMKALTRTNTHSLSLSTSALKTPTTSYIPNLFFGSFTFRWKHITLEVHKKDTTISQNILKHDQYMWVCSAGWKKWISCTRNHVWSKYIPCKIKSKVQSSTSM